MIFKTGFVPATQTEEKTTVATTSVNRPVRRERNLIEIKAPEMFKFTQEGEQIEGYLLAVTETEVNGKRCNEYLLQLLTSDEKKITFLGTWDIDKKFNAIRRADVVKHLICVTYLGEDKDVKTQGNALRRFRLQYDPGDQLKAPNNLEITDDDMPEFLK